MSDVCVSQESNLLHLDRVVLAGYECTSTVLYVFLLLCSILIQIARNFLWTKMGQRRQWGQKREMGIYGCCYGTIFYHGCCSLSLSY